MKVLRDIFRLFGCSLLLLLALTSCKEHSHEWGEWQLHEPPTCLKSGTNVRDCSGCELKDYTTVEATGHSFSEWYVTVPNSCVANGIQKRTCDCGFSEEKVLLSKGGHNFGQQIQTKAPSCTENGLCVSTCIVCLETEESIIHAAHTYIDGVCVHCSRGIVNVIFPQLPLTVSLISSDGNTTYTSCEIKSLYIKMEIENGLYNLLIYHESMLTYIRSGEVARGEFTCTLVAENGEIIASTPATTDILSVGETATDQEIILRGLELDENQSYTLLFTDTALA